MQTPSSHFQSPSQFNPASYQSQNSLAFHRTHLCFVDCSLHFCFSSFILLFPLWPGTNQYSHNCRLLSNVFAAYHIALKHKLPNRKAEDTQGCRLTQELHTGSVSQPILWSLLLINLFSGKVLWYTVALTFCVCVSPVQYGKTTVNWPLN